MAKTIRLYVSVLIIGIYASFSASHLREISNESEKQPNNTLQADYTVLLNAAGVSDCLRPCIEDLISMQAVASDCRDLIGDAANVCAAYKNATVCVRESACKDTEAFDIATKGIQALCVEKMPLLPMVAPCLKKHCEKALSGCDAQCGMTKEIHALATRTEVEKIAAEGGSLIALLEYLGPLCEYHYPRLDVPLDSLKTLLQDSAVRPFEAIARYLQTVSKSTANDIYKRLPDECAPLIDMHYLGRLKFFGALPDRKTTKKPVDQP